MARSTRAAVSGCTPGSPLTTRETVIRLPPAAVATSRMVGRLFTFGRLSSAFGPIGNVISSLPLRGSQGTATLDIWAGRLKNHATMGTLSTLTVRQYDEV